MLTNLGAKRQVYLPAFILYSITKLIYPLYFTCPSAPPSFILYLLQLFYFYTDILTSPLYSPLLLSIYFYCPPTFPFLFFFFLQLLFFLFFLKKERNNSNIVIQDTQYTITLQPNTIHSIASNTIHNNIQTYIRAKTLYMSIQLGFMRELLIFSYNLQILVWVRAGSN